MNRKERKRKRKQRDRKQRETETKTPRENPTQTHSREFKTSRRGVLQLANWRNQKWKKKTAKACRIKYQRRYNWNFRKRHHHEMTRGAQTNRPSSWADWKLTSQEPCKEKRHLTYKTRGHYKDFFKIFFSKRDQVSQGRWPTYVGSNRYTKANSQTSIKLHRDNQP